MKILVLGGSGFLGKRLLSKLIVSGGDIFAGVRSKPDDLVEGCTYLLISELLDNKKYKFDTIINVAMKRSTRHAPVTDEVLRELNFETPLKIISQLSTVDTLVINTSTYIQNYRGVKGNTVENYGYFKERLSEALAIQAGKSKFRVIDLYLFTLFGPGDRETHLVPSLLSALKSGNQISLSEGNQLINLLYLDDAVNSILNAMEWKIQSYSAFYLWDPNYLTVRNLVSIIEDAFMLKMDVVWGGVPYSGHEMFEPWDIPLTKFPDLTLEHSLTEGIKICFDALN